ncbi:MAG TPA: hypothetical protein VNQ73_05430 [Ilumatobacter sp.]|nr:hypothetical protein [Ilumatobacter sp.]
MPVFRGAVGGLRRTLTAVLGWADVDWIRALAYLIGVGVCLVAARVDRPGLPGHWRMFWPLTAVLLAAMAIGRAGDVAGRLRDVVRDGALSDGWYEQRRHWQVAVVAAVGVIWLVGGLAVCLRTLERRPRYLPVVITTAALCGFMAVRMVSLHQVDSILHHRHLAGMRVGTVLEFVLLAMFGGATLVALRPLWALGTARPAIATADASE